MNTGSLGAYKSILNPKKKKEKKVHKAGRRPALAQLANARNVSSVAAPTLVGWNGTDARSTAVLLLNTRQALRKRNKPKSIKGKAEKANHRPAQGPIHERRHNNLGRLGSHRLRRWGQQSHLRRGGRNNSGHRSHCSSTSLGNRGQSNASSTGKWGDQTESQGQSSMSRTRGSKPHKGET